MSAFRHHRELSNVSNSVVTHRIPLDDIVPFYDIFNNRQADVEKVFIETQFSSPPSKGFPATTRVKDWVL